MLLVIDRALQEMFGAGLAIAVPWITGLLRDTVRHQGRAGVTTLWDSAPCWAALITLAFDWEARRESSSLGQRQGMQRLMLFSKLPLDPVIFPPVNRDLQLFLHESFLLLCTSLPRELVFAGCQGGCPSSARR